MHLAIRLIRRPLIKVYHRPDSATFHLTASEIYQQPVVYVIDHTLVEQGE